MTTKGDFNKRFNGIQRQLRIISILMIIASVLFVVLLITPNELSSETPITEQYFTEANDDLIENGIHVKTGFIAKDGYQTVVQNCTSCHSSKLVIQNRMNKERWNATIKWMQETQNLWELGGNQEVIVNYLVTNYPPVEKGRRAKLKIENWYELE